MLPHFSHYLHSNQAPSEREAREIKALRVNPSEEISVIDVEIERIESVLDSLKQKRANIQKSIDDCNTILAPVRSLSTDVLGVIFTYCLATHRNPIMDSSEAPILLTQICRDWRSIALSTPRLWTRIYIPLLQSVKEYQFETLPSIQNKGCRLDAGYEEMQRWLRLSGACPLSITMVPNGGPVSHQPLLDAIVQSSRRWQQFELGYLPPDSDVSKRILDLSADDLCMLREVRLHSTANQETDDDLELWHQSGILTAQSLRGISIGDMRPIGVFPTGIPPNWKNLNHLFIHSLVVLQLANQMLSYCCNLVTCLLSIDWDTGVAANVSITASSFLLPHLKFLSLQGDPTSCSQLFGNIEAPSLRTLDCRGDFPSGNTGSGLFDFLQKIDSLETLVMDYHNLTGDNILRCCTLAPSLTHLVLGQSPKHQYSRSFALHHPHPEQVKLMTALYKVKHHYSSDSAPTVPFPSLEVFEAYGIPSVTDAILLEFIMARIDAARSNDAVSNLRKVLIQFSRPRQTDIIPEALACAEAAGVGLQVELTYDTGNELEKAWSPSSGLSLVDDTSWTYPLYDF